MAYSTRSKIVQTQLDRAEQMQMEEHVALAKVLDRIETKLTNHMVEITAMQVNLIGEDNTG